MLVLGFVLLLIEFFIIPGLGIVGISGLGLLAYGSWLSYTELNIWAGSAVSAGSLLVIILGLKLLPKTSAWKKLNLSKTVDSKSGFKSSPEGIENLIGKKGKTLSALRPSGIAEIEGQRTDVQAEGIFIEKDKEIVVVCIEGSTAIVKKGNG